MIVRDATDLDVLELSLIENLQRADLNPIEEAQAYARLAGEFGLRQEDIAQKVGRSRAAVANSMRLLDLHPASAGVGDARIAFRRSRKGLARFKGAGRTVARSPRRSCVAARPVRDAERLVARQLGTTRPPRENRQADATSATALDDLQNRLQQHLGTRVTLHHGEKRGRIEIEYYGNDDLQRVLTAIGFPATDS